MKAGHSEIKAEKDLGLIGIGTFHAEVATRNEMMFELLSVLDGLNAEKDQAQNHGRAHKDYQPLAIAALGVEDGSRHCEAAANQYQRICKPEFDV